MTCIVCNLLLCMGKGAVGLVSGSVSIVADAVNNLSDASSNVVSLLGFKLASKPADEGHPYGHGRYEYLAGLAVAVIVSALGLDLVKESVGKIFSPEPSEFSPAVVIVLVGSMAVKLWMATFNRRLGRAISSETLIEVMPAGSSKAGAVHTLCDLWGIDPADALAFGDNYNDLPMLDAVGHGYLMGNAPAELLARASLVAPTNDEDGVARVLEHLGLI